MFQRGDRGNLLFFSNTQCYVLYSNAFSQVTKTHQQMTPVQKSQAQPSPAGVSAGLTERYFMQTVRLKCPGGPIRNMSCPSRSFWSIHFSVRSTDWWLVSSAGSTQGDALGWTKLEDWWSVMMAGIHDEVNSNMINKSCMKLARQTPFFFYS